MQILTAHEVAVTLQRLEGNELYSIAALALATGMRRGELLGLQMADIDLDSAEVRVDRSLEETDEGLRFKPPKTKHGRRTISLPASAVISLRDHRVKQLELRMALGLGRPSDDAVVFSTLDGLPISPRKLSRNWLRTCVALGLPRINFHALRAYPCFRADRVRARRRDDLPSVGACKPDRDAEYLRSPLQSQGHCRGRRHRAGSANGKRTLRTASGANSVPIVGYQSSSEMLSA